MTVYLVGAGPGDPGLLTVRGAEVLARADVVVYDRLSVASLLDLAPAGAERISVGKAPGRASLPQAEINALLVERGQAGAEVVRLKGGDPFVFARGGEEAAALQAAGVPVRGRARDHLGGGRPGLRRRARHPPGPVARRSRSSPARRARPASAGRLGGRRPGSAARSSSSWAWRTGPRSPGGSWPAASPPDTPVAAVTWGTRPEQRTVPHDARPAWPGEPMASPAVIVVGAVAALDLRWFEDRPLFGRRIVVTRAREQASELVRTAARRSGQRRSSCR